jgi:hypothetical protein
MSDALQVALSILGAVALGALIIGGIALQNRMQRREIEQGWGPVLERAGLALAWDHEAGGVKAAATGQYRGRPAKLETFRRGTGENQTRYTAISLTVQNPSGAALELRPRRWFDRLGGGVQDAQVGDPDFDAAYQIGASAEGFAADVLGSGIRAALMQIPDVDLKLKGASLRYAFAGLDTNPQRLLGLLDVMSDLADSIEEEGGVEVRAESRVLAEAGEEAQEAWFASDAAPSRAEPAPPGASQAANPYAAPSRARSALISVILALALFIGAALAAAFVLSGGQ